MRRRDFIGLLGGAAAAWPLAAQAQQGDRVRWIGVLMINPESDDVGRAWAAAFEQTLAKLGWAVGRNLAIDYRWGITTPETARIAIAQVLRLTPDMIVANGGPALTAAQQATSAVPIVFTGLSEPVERGFVANMARPGGNTTGFTNLEATMGGKWLELLKEIAPRVSRVTAIFNPTSSFAALFFKSAEAAGQRLGVEVAAAHVGNLAEIDAAATAVARVPNGGLFVTPDGFTGAFRRQIVDMTFRDHLPAIASDRSFAGDGGLLSYGPDRVEMWRQTAGYVDRVLKGEKPGDLSVQAPTKYELVINLKTAKALGLTVPATLLVSADEVIEQ